MGGNMDTVKLTPRPVKLSDAKAVQHMLDVEQEGKRVALFTAETLTALYKQARNNNLRHVPKAYLPGCLVQLASRPASNSHKFPFLSVTIAHISFDSKGEPRLDSVERLDLTGYQQVAVRLTYRAVQALLENTMRDNNIYIGAWKTDIETLKKSVLDCPDDDLPMHLVSSAVLTAKEIAIWRLKNMRKES